MIRLMKWIYKSYNNNNNEISISIKPGCLSSNNNKNNNTMGVEIAPCDCRFYEPFTFKCRGYRNSNEPERRPFFLLTMFISTD